MNFTPRFKAAAVVDAILAVAVVGLIGWGMHATSTLIPTSQDNPAVEELLPANDAVWIIAAPEAVPTPDPQATRSDSYQLVTAWYKNKHWWKKNAPIIGGAAGGGLVGGLLGGGKGALIGGGVGAGGGYLYKRSKHHHYQNNYNYQNKHK